MNEKTFNRTLACMLAMLFLAAAALPAQERVTLSSLLSSLPGMESSIRIADASTRSAFEGFQDLLARARPQIFFSTNAGSPLYGFSYTKRASGLTGIETKVVETHRTSPGLAVSQMLPTAGNLSFSLGDSITVIRSDDKTHISQSPSLSLSLSQPVFLNGKIIDFSLFGATLRQGEIGYEKASRRGNETVNKAILNAATLYFNTVNLYKNVRNLENSVKISDTRLAQAEVSYEQGRTSRTDLRDLELKAAQQRESLLELRYNLNEMLGNLRRMTGKADLDVASLSDEFAQLEIPSDKDAHLKKALESNPSVVAGKLDLEQTRLKGILDGREFQSELSVSFSLTPRYPVNRPSMPGVSGSTYTTDDFAKSWSDLFAEGSWLDYNIGVGLNIPLYTGGRRGHQTASQTAAEAISVESLESARKAVTDRLELITVKREYLTERVTLLRDTVAHREDLLRREEKLLELKATIPIEVETAKLDLEDAKNKLWFAGAELFLNSLELLTLTGDDLTRYPGVLAEKK